jgi:hypothetical protein
VPDAASGEVFSFVREFHSGGLPAGRRADALQRRAKGVFPAAGTLRRFPD